MMNQERLKAYLDVIQGLLSCPAGEEWILLRQHQGLVNAELVEVMEQVAHRLTAQGDTKAGKYLHNWAGKLHHILTENIPVAIDNYDKTQAYLKFVKALLDCTDDCSEAEIIEANEDLIDPKLIKMMREIARKMALEGDRSSAEYLDEMAADLNAVWLHKHNFEPTFKPEIAADPWLDEDSEAQHLPVTASQPDSSKGLVKEQVQPASLTTQAEIKSTLQPTKRRTTANILIKLESILATRLQPANPLWYMDVLEKALANNWILTTDEVEKLIGVKPHCEHNQTEYRRGCWIFTKTGKIGAKTGWSIDKVVES
ncbi:MAG: hypothetical protein AAFY50_23600 [Cyanobacteria bacterium J06648_1]